MAEYVANAEQEVALNNPILFSASIPCNKGYVWHPDESGIFVLRGKVNNPNCCFARYQVTFNGNIAIPEEGEVTPIAVAITEFGEPRLTSRAIFTPADADEYGNVTSTAIITIPAGCCVSVSVRAVAATNDVTVTPAPAINVQNANLVIDRIA